MLSLLDALIVALSSVIASSGFWAYMTRRDKSRSATDRLLRGLAYGQIAKDGLALIERGWITKDELEEFRKYLYEPYKELGGNGVADRIMREIDQLPLVNEISHTMMIKDLKGSSRGRHRRPDQRPFAQRQGLQHP